MRIHDEDFDVRKIAESGQCFRLIETAPGVFELIARGRRLVLTETDGAVAFESADTAFWSEYFDLVRDYKAVRARADQNDAFLCTAAEYGKGIRILRQEPFETLITFIISQQKNMPAIRTCVEKLCAAYGETVEGSARRAFPTPEALAAAGESALRALGLGYRAPYIAASAEMAAAGALDGLDALGDSALEAALRRFPGVGPKVAHCVMLFGYGRLSGFPRDVWINRVIDAVYGGAFDTARYKGAEGIIQQYLFYYGRSPEGQRALKKKTEDHAQ